MKARIQLPLQTVSLTVGFMAWVVLSTLLPFMRADIDIPPSMVAVLTAIPIVLGSVLRIPFGCWTNAYGARIVFAGAFIFLAIPLWVIGEATEYGELLFGGALLGVAGAVFSVGVTSLPKYYPKSRQGFANGVYGLGNIGTAITAFCAPSIAVCLGWQATVRLYLALMVVMALLNVALGDKREPRSRVSLVHQLRSVQHDRLLWVLSAFYFVTFGAFVAFTVVLPSFLVSNYGLSGVDAGVLTGVFVVLAAAFRPLGGWLGDRFNCMRLLAGVFACLAAVALAMAASFGLAVLLAGAYALSLACGIGNGVVFKLVPQHFREQAAPVNGVVSMMGGLGGFFPPFVLHFANVVTGTHATAFVLLALSAAVCLAMAVRGFSIRRTCE